MARIRNPNRTTTPIMIDKILKLKIDRLRNKDSKRQGNESDNTVLSRIIPIYMEEHSSEVHEPRTTYSSKTN